VQKHDIVTLTETKLDEKASSTSLAIDGYMLNRQDRSRNGGGVCTYINDRLQPKVKSKIQAKYVKQGLEVTITKITVQKPISAVIIIGVYRPPNAKVIWFEKFNELLLEVLKDKHLVIMGDLNADLLTSSSHLATLLINSFALAGVTVKHVEATRITNQSSSCLDVIAVSDALSCTEYKVGGLAASDHFPVESRIEINQLPPVKPIAKRSFRMVDMKDLSHRVEAISIGNEDANVMIEEWTQQFTSIIDDVAPVKSCPMRRKRVPWFNAKTRKLIKIRDATARRMKGTTDRHQIGEDLKIANKRVKSNLRRASKEYGKELLSSKDPKATWKFIKSTTFTETYRERTNIEPVKLNEYFADIVKSPSYEQSQVTSSCDQQDSFHLQPLGVHAVKSMLSSLNARTAAGHDEIPGFLLKELASSLALNIAKIFNTTIATGIFPNSWKKANVTGVWKNKGSKKDPSNYRPISVLPVLARTLEKAVASQLYEFCDVKEVIPKQQYGFRRNSGCEMTLVAALDSWMRSIDEGKLVGAILLDFSKAFDTVPHQLLLNDLKEIGCGMDALRWFASYLQGRQQRVVQRPKTTQWMDITRGVPQGSCLSPLLFNIFVRALPAITEAETFQYADDTTQSEADSSSENILQKLTTSFNKTKEFCEARELKINADKTQFIVFKPANKRLPEQYAITLGGATIKPSDAVQLLGFTLDRHLTMGDHINATVKKCQAMIGVLSRAAPFLPKDLLRMAYISLIRSHLEYASAAFASAAPTHLKKLDIIQKISSRIIMHAPRNAHSATLQLSLNLETLEKRRHDHIIALIRSCVSGKCHPTFRDKFVLCPDETVMNNCTAKRSIGHKRFSVYAKKIFNDNLA
jgi:Reverse transcriptase (RNA-dependent DNA polymerase)/Endonuclease-reverse transcriptase